MTVLEKLIVMAEDIRKLRQEAERSARLETRALVEGALKRAQCEIADAIATESEHAQPTPGARQGACPICHGAGAIVVPDAGEFREEPCAHCRGANHGT